jgi:drug/metabolite transporter (DMT)-like permease
LIRQTQDYFLVEEPVRFRQGGCRAFVPASPADRQPMKTRRHPVLDATVWMAGALLSFTAMALGARELSTQLGTFEILFFRSVIGLAILSLLCRYGWRQVSTRHFGTHLLRNCAHFGGQYGWFYGIASIPLTEVFAIEFTVPIWTTLLAIVLVGERLTRARLMAVGLGRAGMLVILHPGATAIHPAALAVLLGALAYGLSHVLTKRLVRTDTPLTILFYMTVVQLPLGLIPSLAHWRVPAPVLWPWLLVVGVSRSRPTTASPERWRSPMRWWWCRWISCGSR